MIRAVAHIPNATIWFGFGLWVLLTGALLFGTGWQLNQNYQFAYHSLPALATVEKKFVRVSQGSHGHTNYTPCLDYHYQAGTMLAHCVSSVQNDTYAAVSEGEEFPIRYLQDEPARHRIELPAEMQRIRFTTYALLVASLFFVVGGAYTHRRCLQQNKRYAYLRSNGLACVGKVTALKYDVTNKGRTKRYYLLFTFRDNQGRERTGRSWYLKPGNESLWRETSPIRVYYDLNDSENFTVDLNSGPSDR